MNAKVFPVSEELRNKQDSQRDSGGNQSRVTLGISQELRRDSFGNQGRILMGIKAGFFWESRRDSHRNQGRNLAGVAIGIATGNERGLR